MFLDKSRKSAGRKRSAVSFLLLSLLLHAAVLVFLADSEKAQERISRVEVGLVSLPPRVAAENTVPEARSGTGSAPAAGERAPDPLSTPPAGKNVERNAAFFSDVANFPQERPLPECDAASAKAPLPGMEPPSTEKTLPAESPAPEGQISEAAADRGIEPVPIASGIGGSGAEPMAIGGKAEVSASLPRIEAMPRYDRNAPPPYPRLARERGWEGEVLLRVLVSATGDVRSVAVERSSKHAVLDAAALGAVRRWRFHPSRLGAIPVEGEVLVPLRFRLRDF